MRDFYQPYTYYPPHEECCSLLRFTEVAKSLPKKSSEFLGCEDAIVWPIQKLSKYSHFNIRKQNLLFSNLIPLPDKISMVTSYGIDTYKNVKEEGDMPSLKTTEYRNFQRIQKETETGKRTKDAFN